MSEEEESLLHAPAFVARLAAKVAAAPAHTKVLLAIATTMFVVELLLRHLAPDSELYKGWTKVFLAIGHFWTAILLSVVYFLSISVMSLMMKLFAKDPLDRGLEPEETFWRPHVANPLGPEAAARHQF